MVNDIIDTDQIIKQEAMVQILEMHENDLEGASILECTAEWMEANGLQLNKANIKYIPAPILDKIKLEVLDSKLMRPSQRSLIATTSLSGFFE